MFFGRVGVFLVIAGAVVGALVGGTVGDLTADPSDPYDQAAGLFNYGALGMLAGAVAGVAGRVWWMLRVTRGRR